MSGNDARRRGQLKSFSSDFWLSLISSAYVDIDTLALARVAEYCTYQMNYTASTTLRTQHLLIDNGNSIVFQNRRIYYFRLAKSLILIGHFAGVLFQLFEG